MSASCRLTKRGFARLSLTNRFEQLTQGRLRGQEDVSAHEPKGTAGDWRNYFSDEITRRLKKRFAGVLIATGYARDFG
jgi:hypothetical protein